jgi:Fe-S cluster assembly scaffold protein SufB
LLLLDAGTSVGLLPLCSLLPRTPHQHTAQTTQPHAQVETGSAITWKYPSVVLKGDGSVGQFFSVALTNHHQQADTGAPPAWL